MIPIRRFNEQGISRFEQLLDEVKENGDGDPQTIVYDPNLTEILHEEPIMEVRPFENRLDAGQYFYHLLRAVEDRVVDLDRDRGLWSWLAAVWMDEIAPSIAGTRTLGEQARWVLSSSFRRYYRHLLAGPYRIYRAHREHPERVMAVLANPVGQPGEVVAQFASRQEIVSNPSLLEALTKLYYEPSIGRLKRGSGGKGAGSPRRLAQDVLPQFDLTWDFFVMQPDEILALLPAEFDRFRSAGTSG